MGKGEVSLGAALMERILPSVIMDAAEKGVAPEVVIRVVTKAMAEAYPAPENKFAAAGLAGRVAIMKREGGCIDARKAASLYAGAVAKAPAVPETVRKAAREKRLISVKDGMGGLLFPAWQFHPDEGGALPDLPKIIKTLSARPGYSDITPFVFFLQPHERLGMSPLKALRKGNVSEVIKAAQEYAA